MRRRGTRFPVTLIALVVLVTGLGAASSASAQTIFGDELVTPEVPPGFGSDLRAFRAYELLERGRLVRARELAESILADAPEDFAGHLLLGAVHHRAEGNLPRALFHLRHGRELFETRWSDSPNVEAPWRWHAFALIELAFVTGSMGHHEDKIAYLLERDALYDPPMPAERGWPLMRLRRYEDARQVAYQGLASGDPQQAAVAYTALCAIEAEEHLRADAHRACLKAADHARSLGPRGPTVFTNAAEASLGMLRLDEAERLILEGTKYFSWGTVSNPWMDLTVLYVGQGRFGPGLDSLRNMFAWRNRQPAFVDIQNRSEIDMTAIAFLLAAGEAKRAVEIADRVLDRPDRTGFTSSEAEQLEAAAAVLASVAHRTRAVQLDEIASYEPFFDSLGTRFEAMRHRWRGRLAAKRAAAAMAEERMLEATLRPYLAGSVEMPEWFEPELVHVMGAGMVDAVLTRARETESLESATPYFDLFDAEVAFAQGRSRAAMDLAALAGETLPQAEVMLRARVAAVGAKAALEAGDGARAAGFLDRALQLDPGIVRRFDLALPATVAAGDGAVAARAARLIRRSPRLDLGGRAAGRFRVLTDSSGDNARVRLLDRNGTVVADAAVRRRAGESDDDLARRLAAAFHDQGFAPRVDLTEADLRSLDGAPTAAGGRSAERIRSVLDELTEP